MLKPGWALADLVGARRDSWAPADQVGARRWAGKRIAVSPEAIVHHSQGGSIGGESGGAPAGGGRGPMEKQFP